jgi:hypothetical protein
MEDTAIMARHHYEDDSDLSTRRLAERFCIVDTAIGGTDHRNRPMKRDAFRFSSDATDV